MSRGRGSFISSPAAVDTVSGDFDTTATVTGTGAVTATASVGTGGGGGFVVTARHSGNLGTSSAQTLTTSSTTPTADSLLLAFYAAENDGHTPPPPWVRPPAVGCPTRWSTRSATRSPSRGTAATDFRISSALYQATVGLSPRRTPWSSTPTQGRTSGSMPARASTSPATTPPVQWCSRRPPEARSRAGPRKRAPSSSTPPPRRGTSSSWRSGRRRLRWGSRPPPRVSVRRSPSPSTSPAPTPRSVYGGGSVTAPSPPRSPAPTLGNSSGTTPPRGGDRPRRWWRGPYHHRNSHRHGAVTATAVVEGPDRNSHRHRRCQLDRRRWPVKHRNRHRNRLGQCHGRRGRPSTATVTGTGLSARRARSAVATSPPRQRSRDSAVAGTAQVAKTTTASVTGTVQ